MKRIYVLICTIYETTYIIEKGKMGWHKKEGVFKNTVHSCSKVRVLLLHRSVTFWCVEWRILRKKLVMKLVIIFTAFISFFISKRSSRRMQLIPLTCIITAIHASQHAWSTSTPSPLTHTCTAPHNPPNTNLYSHHWVATLERSCSTAHLKVVGTYKKRYFLNWHFPASHFYNCRHRCSQSSYISFPFFLIVWLIVGLAPLVDCFDWL